MFIVKKRKKGGPYYYSIASTEYVKGMPRQRIIRYLGKAERILEVFECHAKRRQKSIR